MNRDGLVDGVRNLEGLGGDELSHDLASANRFEVMVVLASAVFTLIADALPDYTIGLVR